MAEMTIRDFGGRLPRRSKRLLPGNFSQECTNAKLLSGELRGFRAPVPVHTFASGTNPKRAWRVFPTGDQTTEYWVSSQYPEAELVKCPLINDSFDRWYLFEPGEPVKVFTMDDIINGTGPYDVAFTQPTTPPTLTPTPAGGDVRDVVYVYTYVTSWGEESSPSEPATVQVDDAGTVTVSGFYTPTPTIEGRTFEKVRIYRSVSFGGTADIFYVGEVDWGVDTFLDDKIDAEVSLNEILPVTNTNTPPPDGIYGARVHPSGAMVAFKGRDVYFSQPYKPHLWNETWQVAVEDTIVGIETWEQNIGVFTQGRPYMIYGSTPAQTGLLRFPMPEPCVAYGSIVGAPEGAYYASHQGLVLFTAVGPRNITRELISKEEWETDYLDERISAARYGTQYVAVERPGSGFILDNLEARIALTDILTLAPLLTTFDEDYYTGDVYGVAGDTVYRWDDTTAEEIDYIWKSKQEVVARPLNMGAVMVHIEPRSDEYIPPGGLPSPPFPPEYATIDKKNEVLVEVFLNDKRVFAGACGNRKQVRIPSGEKGDSWEVRITGQCRLYSVALTETGRGQSRSG